MNPSSLAARLTALVAVTTLCLLGCSKGPQGPQVTADAFPRAFRAVEEMCDEILSACEAGKPAEAHNALHQVSKRFNAVQTVAQVVKMPGEVGDQIEAKLMKLEAGLSKIDASLHDDPKATIDAEVVASLRETLSSLRQGLPTEVTAELMKLDTQAAEREAKRAASAEQASSEAKSQTESDPLPPEEDTAPIDTDDTPDASLDTVPSTTAN
ncbi:hypothetical protein [Botrimarina hoheduenensis]|uniref:Uncharacterized protein n=1 Tax=Botrimarina hoheduenensis TaxID=2528000 RepID=A0A5C5VTS0_9BACT|nr:hypothetical protein [Botrimarina hoheduenensis]TWT41537.1 hypothetical protein Pla111_29140 [Botrimarina hoheduenensis]